MYKSHFLIHSLLMLVQAKHKSGPMLKKNQPNIPKKHSLKGHFPFLFSNNNKKKNEEEKCEQTELKIGTTSNCCPTLYI